MPGCDLPRSARLHRAADFAALRKARGRVQDHCFVFRYGPNGQAAARLGMAVSRKVSRHAVERNRIKRLIRESFRACRGRLPRVDVLVIARRDAAARSGPVLRAQLDRLWSRVRPLNDGSEPGKMAR